MPCGKLRLILLESKMEGGNHGLDTIYQLAHRARPTYPAHYRYIVGSLLPPASLCTPNGKENHVKDHGRKTKNSYKEKDRYSEQCLYQDRYGFCRHNYHFHDPLRAGDKYRSSISRAWRRWHCSRLRCADSGQDIFNRVLILLENQSGLGDVVKVAGIVGLVEDITLRRTVLRDLEAIVHSIPNSEIA